MDGRMILRSLGVKNDTEGLGEAEDRRTDEKGRDRGGGERMGEGGNKDVALVGDEAESGGVMLVDLTEVTKMGFFCCMVVTSCSTLRFVEGEDSTGAAGNV